MNTAKVNYKGKEYLVHNPGTLMNRPRFVDQLNKNLPDMDIRRKNKYLLDTYSLSPEDYYIIVMYLGDETKVPKCKCRRCSNRSMFSSCNMKYKEYCSRSCVATETNLKGMEEGYNKWIITNRDNWVNPFSGEAGSELSRNFQKRLVAEGRHPWAGEKGSQLQRSKLENGTHPFLREETKMKGVKRAFELKGNPDDVCYLYLAKENKSPGIVKLGITCDLNKRSGHYGNYYTECQVLVEDARLVIANLEYLTKVNFIGKAVKGDEYFSEDLEPEIINFVKSLYNK